MIKFNRSNYPEFSNFHICKVEVRGLLYSSSEAAFQSLKTRMVNERIKFCDYAPGVAKKMGRKVTLRPDWEEVKYDIMLECLCAKFTQNPELRDLLLSTGDEEILEDTTAWHDNTWGSCSCPKCVNIEGQNLLGKALVEVRDMLRAGKI